MYSGANMIHPTGMYAGADMMHLPLTFKPDFDAMRHHDEYPSNLTNAVPSPQVVTESTNDGPSVVVTTATSPELDTSTATPAPSASAVGTNSATAAPGPSKVAPTPAKPAAEPGKQAEPTATSSQFITKPTIDFGAGFTRDGNKINRKHY